MSEQITINSFEDLIEVLETNNLSNKDAEEIVSKAIGVYTLMDLNKDKSNFINELKSFWKIYKNKPLTDRPIFLINY